MNVARHDTHILLAAREPATFADEAFWTDLVAALVGEGAVVTLWAETATPAFVRRLEHEGTRVARLHWPTDGPAARLIRAPRLARRLAAAGAGLIHVFGLDGAGILLAAARRAGAHTVLAPDRLPEPDRPQAGRAGARLRRLLAGFDAVELPSQSAAERLQAAVPELAGRIRVVPPGLDVEPRSPERVGGRRIAALVERWHLDAARRIVLLPGPIRRGRGHLLALRAMAACDRDDFDLLFLGDERADPAFGRELQAVLRATGLAERVRFAAAVDDRPAAFALADLVLHFPAPEELEPLPLLEAQAAGVPVVTASGSGLEEFLLPAVTGWLVPTGDRDALAAAMAAALSLGPDARARLAERCRDFVAAHHRPERAIAARLRLYRSVLDAAAAARTAPEVETADGSARE